MVERRFTTAVLVEIDSFGLPEVHRSPIIARVTREMQLQFGGNAHVTRLIPGPIIGGAPSYVLHGEVVEEQMQPMGTEASVPEVQTPEADAGAGLRSVSDNMHPVRLSFQSKDSDGGTP